MGGDSGAGFHATRQMTRRLGHLGALREGQMKRAFVNEQFADYLKPSSIAHRSASKYSPLDILRLSARD